MEKNALESTNKLLKVMIALLLRQKVEDAMSQREQIKILNDLGVRPVQIAEILGRPSKFINKELAVINKNRKEALHGKR